MWDNPETKVLHLMFLLPPFPLLLMQPCRQAWLPLLPLMLWHVRKDSEDLQAMQHQNNIQKQFNFTETSLSKNMIKNCVYSIPYSCSKEYKIKNSQPLKKKLKEHKKTKTEKNELIRCETMKLCMAYL